MERLALIKGLLGMAVKDLKATAEALGIKSPSGNKRLKKTWIDVILAFFKITEEEKSASAAVYSKENKQEQEKKSRFNPNADFSGNWDVRLNPMEDKDYVKVGHPDRKAWLTYFKYIPVEKRTIADWELFRNYCKNVSDHGAGKWVLQMFKNVRDAWGIYWKKVVEIGKADFLKSEWREWESFWYRNRRLQKSIEDLWKDWKDQYWKYDNGNSYSYGGYSNWNSYSRNFITPKEFEALSLLNLRENCTKEDVKKVKIELNKKYHPDLNKTPGAEELLKRFNSAIDTVLQYISRNTSYAAC